ncbi:MAG TPA: hypothetical protein VF898_01110 [Chloroflexota bacterium]
MRRWAWIGIAVALAAVLFVPSLASAGSVQPLSPVLTADGRLGLDDVLPNDSSGAGVQWSQLAYNAGARMNRWEFRWDRIEAQPNVWDYSADDPVVQSARGGGLSVLGILIGTPKWALAPGQKPGNGVPKNLGLPYTDPQNVWAEYVRQTVIHYAGEVKYWEIWNEPDLAYFWHGNADDYFGMLKDAYLTIKSIDPTAQVVVGGMVVPDLQFFDHVLQDAARAPNARANHGYFDTVAWHVYGPARGAYDNIMNMRQQLAINGFGGTPVWVTEAGFPASNPGGEPRQAAYVLQTVAYSLAAGAARLLIYRASDDTSNKSWGLMDTAGHPRMGYITFQLAASYFAHTQGIVLAPKDGVQRLSLYRPGQRSILLWDSTVRAQSISLPADQPSASVTDWQGHTATVQSAGGTFNLLLPGASYNAGVDPSGSVVGSPPVLVTQNNAVPAGLTATSTLLSPTGAGRRLVLFNPTATPAQAVVAPAGRFWQHESLSLAARTVQVVDLDLLSSPGFAGLYTFASSSPLQLLELSNAGTFSVVHASPTWYAANAPTGLTLGNPSGASASVTVTSLGPHGSVRSRVSLVLLPHGRALWSQLPALGKATLALQVRSDVPVLARRSDGGQLVAQPATNWSVLRPGRSRLAVFNADPRRTVHVDIARLGPNHLPAATYSVKPRRILLLRGRNARALKLSADGAVVAQYVGNAGVTAPPVVPTVETEAILSAPTSVTLFNPGQQTAHVRLTSNFGGGSQLKSRSLQPLQQIVIRLAASPEHPRGVSVISDAPVATSLGY